MRLPAKHANRRKCVTRENAINKTDGVKYVQKSEISSRVETQRTESVGPALDSVGRLPGMRIVTGGAKFAQINCVSPDDSRSLYAAPISRPGPFLFCETII